MDRKYEMKICECGRIHMIPIEKIDNALDKNKHFVLVCAGCGDATVIGANVESDYLDPRKDCYMMYSTDLSSNKDKSIIVNDFSSTDEQKGIEEIFYSHGIKVPMMTGMYATDFSCDKFSDRWYPDFYKIQRSDITVAEIMQFINEYTHDRTTVNMARLISETPDEMLDVISQYYIEAFDWRGTKWESEFNSK